MTDIQKEEKEPITYTCDCGFTWQHGKSGSHICGPYYRERIAKLEQELQAARRSQPEEWISGAPKDPGLVVKGWHNGSLWAGRFNGSEKMASCDFHLNLPPIAAAPDGGEG